MSDTTARKPGTSDLPMRTVRGLHALLAILIVAGCLSLVAGAAVGFNMYMDFQTTRMMQRALDRDTFYDGLSIDGIDISNMTMDQARAAVTSQIQQVDGAQKLQLAYQGRTWSITANDFSFLYDTEDVLERAYGVGRSGTLLQRYEEITAVKERKVALQTTWKPGQIRVEGHIQRIADDLYIEMKNAAVDTFSPSTKAFTYTKEQKGQRVDTAELQRMILERFRTRAFDEPIQVPVVPIEPSVRLADIQGKYRKLATFTTTTTDNSARNTNIRLCAQAFNGARVEPGDVFSLNEMTGQRTESKGYRPAGAIVGGKLVEEPGGGVCQVSTTLMNAVVRSGLELVERSHHSWPSTYVKIGMDAAINWPNQDFKFRNNSQGTVFLVSSFSGNELTVSVYGYPILASNEKIDLSSVLLSTAPPKDPKIIYDSSMREGQRVTEKQARDEKRSKTYIHYYKDGVEVKKEVLFNDTYRAIQGIVRVGTKRVEAPVVESAPVTGP